MDHRDLGLKLRNVDPVLFVLQATRHVAILARLGPRVLGVDLVFIFAVEPFQVGCLLDVVVELPELGDDFAAGQFVGMLARIREIQRSIDVRQNDRVARGAELRGLQKGVVLRLQAGRVLHGVGRDLVVLERAVDLAFLAEVEIPRVRRLEKVLQVGAVIGGGLGTRLHPMADDAAHPVAGQGAVFRVAVPEVRSRVGDLVDVVDRE